MLTITPDPRSSIRRPALRQHQKNALAQPPGAKVGQCLGKSELMMNDSATPFDARSNSRSAAPPVFVRRR
jgi:hypothetical protein